MICVVHGYLLEGSGSNLWTRLMVEAMCRRGETVHVMCQENHPSLYPFISEQRRYGRGKAIDISHFETHPSYAGSCILHKPILDDALPVFVWDRYEEFDRVIPMIELSDDEIEAYVEWNATVLERIVTDNDVTAIHANHLVLMPQVAQRVHERTGVPFGVMPHGSELEYAMKRDQRFVNMAEDAVGHAEKIFVHGDEMRQRVRDALPDVAALESKFVDLHLGVDTSQFEPVTRCTRSIRIEQLKESVSDVKRGRAPDQTAAMLAALDTARGVAELSSAFDGARGYDTKAPDRDLEPRLETIDWMDDSTLLYVGRLISTKGIQGVIAALPLLLEETPDLRLIVVGHGPLREPLEGMLRAMERGDMKTLRMIAEHGRTLEHAPQGESGGTSLTQVCHFLDQLNEAGRMEHYAQACAKYIRADRVLFTGYLTHRQLRFLFPCCDAAIFPSVIREAGPLVFLEALASGAFPLGTYFGGMRASIDAVSHVLPGSAIEVMKLSADPQRTVADIVQNVPRAIALGDVYKKTLFNFAREHYDWTSVADEFRHELEEMCQPSVIGSRAPSVPMPL